MSTGWRVVPLLLLGAIVVGCLSMTSAPEGLPAGKPAPEVEGVDADGKEFKLSDYRGKVVMLSFWKKDCPPCRGLFPHERSLVQKYGGQPFALLGVNVDGSVSVLRQSQEKFGLTWRSWSDDGRICERWGVQSLPAAYLVDHRGIVRYSSLEPPAPEVLDKKIGELVREAEADAKQS